MPGRIHLTARLIPFHDLQGALRALLTRGNQLTLNIAWISRPTGLDNPRHDLNNRVLAFIFFSISFLACLYSASLNGPVKRRGTKGEVLERKAGLLLPLGRFLLKRAQEVRGSSRAQLRETIVGSPLSTAHEKRKFTAMGLLAALFRVTVIQRSSCIHDWNWNGIFFTNEIT